MDRYKQIIYSSLEAIFAKVLKHPLNVEGLERLRLEVEKLTEAICKTADAAALERCKKLNDAIDKAFNEKLFPYLQRIEAKIENKKASELIPWTVDSSKTNETSQKDS